MDMKIEVYRGDSLITESIVTKEHIRRGYTTIECPSCEGTGVFEITDEYSQKCVECSTKGEIVVSL